MFCTVRFLLKAAEATGGYYLGVVMMTGSSAISFFWDLVETVTLLLWLDLGEMREMGLYYSFWG